MIFRLLVVSLLSTSIVGLPLPDPKSKDDSPDCQNCKFVISLVHDIWGDQTLDDCLGDLADFVCTVLQIEDHFVCKTITTGFRDEVLWILGQILVEPDEICSLLLPNCGVFFDPFDVTWSVDVPGDKPPVQPYPVPPSGKPTLRVLHLSDLHIDMEYQEGLEAKCSEPQCCRPQSDPQEISKDDVKEAAGHWGTVGNCDSPYYLVTNMLQHIADTHKDLDYIVVSGDLESHADWVYTHESHAAMVRNISATITQFLPGIPAFFAVGNHEGVPIDNFAPRWSPPQFNISWLYDAMADSWASWVGVDAVTTVRYNACFMVKLYPGLRLISLNNGLGDSNNFWLYVNQTDPDGAMTWFRDQLLEAEKAGDKVHVVAHIPGGSGELLESWNMNYYNITNRFENTIMAHFFGHEHSEEFVIQFENPDDEKSRATAVVLSAPSVTTYSSYNPAYRIYTVDGVYEGSSYALIDFEDYYLDLKKANADPQNPKWETLFASARTEYGLNSMAPTEWSEMINRMKTDDDLFQRYRNNYFRHTDRATSSCDQGCRHGFLCDARRAHHTDKLCDDLQGAQVRSTRRAAKLAKKQSTRNSPSLIELQSRVENFKRNRDADTCPI